MGYRCRPWPGGGRGAGRPLVSALCARPPTGPAALCPPGPPYCARPGRRPVPARWAPAHARPGARPRGRRPVHADGAAARARPGRRPV